MHSTQFEEDESEAESDVDGFETVVKHEQDSPNTTLNYSVRDSEVCSPNNPVYLPTVDGIVASPDDVACCETVPIFLDPGCDASLVLNSLAQKLGLRPVYTQTQVVRTIQNEPKTVLSTIYRLDVVEPGGTRKTINVHGVDTLVNHLKHIKIDKQHKARRSFEHSLVLPEVLLGSDCVWDFIKSIGKKLPEGVYPITTTLGNIYSGRLKKGADVHLASTQISPFDLKDAVVLEEQKANEEEIKRLWQLDAIGVVDSVKDDDAEIALKMFQQTVRRENGRYVVRFPFKEPNPSLPSNFGLCFGRLQSVCNRLQQDPQLMKMYSDVIHEQLEKEYIEPVLDWNKVEGPLVHYLPHHAVIKMNKAHTKCRLVFDASAKCRKNAPSLNSVLYPGACLLPSLCGLLARARTYPILITSDLARAFMQVQIDPSDREICRFLFLKDITKPATYDNLCVYRFKVTAFGIVSSPFLLGCVLQTHLQNWGTPFAQHLAENAYVDNIFTLASTQYEALERCQEAKNIFADAKFELREFCSNNAEVRRQFADDPKETQSLMLGLDWNMVEDSFTFALPTPPTGALTKRKVLQCIAKLFDPCGFLVPTLLQAKLEFQKTWVAKLKWDEPLPFKLVKTWNEVTADWGTHRVRLKRKITADNTDNVELHIFVDASKDSYACVAYVRVLKDKKWHSDIVFAKSRLRPLKDKVSIPRMELLACVIGARLAVFLREEMKLQFTKTVLHSDSMAVLSWLKTGTSEKSRFIVNWLNSICQANITEYRYVPTDLNAADVASRGCDLRTLDSHPLWWSGPHFLSRDDSLWDPQPYFAEPKIKVDTTAFSFEGTKHFNAAVTEVLTPVIDVSRYSSYKKAVNVAAYVLKYLKKVVLDKCAVVPAGTFSTLKTLPETRQVTSEDFGLAELVLLREAQRRDEPSKEEKNRFGIYTDANGLARCTSRLVNSDLATDAKNPIWLPHKAWVTKLICLDYHLKHFHAEVSHTVNQLRSRFCLAKDKQTTKSALYLECYECKRRKAKPFARPEMASLPKERVTPAVPWSRVGLDYWGPEEVSVGPGQTQKMWICLFTDQVSRSVHLEPAFSLSTDDFLRCFTRFVSLRGRPDVVYSDNMAAYKAGDQALRQIWPDVNDESLSAYLAKSRITWRYSTPLAPWENGFTERLVQTVKRAYKSAKGRRVLTLQELLTLLPKISAITNTRPVVHLPETPMQALRPVDLLGTPAPPGFPSGDAVSSDPTYMPRGAKNSEKYIEAWKRTLELADKFWQRFHVEYLTSLRQSHVLNHRDPRCKETREPLMGEVCLIAEDNSPKGSWRLGKIVSLNRGKEGFVRSAVLQVADGHTLTRAVNLLYPLEIRDTQAELQESDSTPPFTALVEAAEPINSDALPATASTSPPAVHGQRQSKRLRKKSPIRFTQFAASTRQPKVGSMPLWLLGVLCVLAPVTAQKCPQNTNGLVRVDGPVCTSLGAAIYRHPTKPPTYCWQKLYCRAGHITPANVTKTCGPACTCPQKWMQNCSFYKGRLTKNSTSSRNKIARALLAEMPDNYSTTLVTNGAANSVFVTLPKVQLFDDSEHIVKSLALVHREIIAAQFTCLGKGLRSGTSEFCRGNKCYKNATAFCYYAHSEAVFLQLPSGPIAIKGWGVANVSVYPRYPRSYSAHCDMCTINCTEQGASVALSHNFSALEVCEPHECHTKSNPSLTENFVFPLSTKIAAHSVTATVWNHGQIIKKLSTQCPPIDFCKQIHSWFSLAVIENPKCMPKIAIILLTILAYVASIVIIALARACGVIRDVGQILFHFLRFSVNMLRKVICLQAAVFRQTGAVFRRGRRPSDENIPLVRPRRIGLKPLVFIAVIAAAINQGAACSDFVSLIGQEDSCFSDTEGITKCTFDQAMDISVQPRGQTFCVLLKDSARRPVGTLKLRANELVSSCNKVTKQFTAPHEIMTQSVKRCSESGSCTSQRCSTVNATEMLPELQSANQYAGRTECLPGKGGWGAGCFYFSDGCIFHRLYALPKSHDIYEIFSCPTWDTRVSVTAELLLGSENYTHSFELKIGETEQWSQIKVSLKSAGSDPAPALGNYFLYDQKRVGIAPFAPTVMLNCTNGFQSKPLDCVFPAGVCHCRAIDERAVCSCREQVTYALEETSLLPQQIGGLWFFHENGAVNAKLPSSAISLQIVLSGLKVQSDIDANTCKISDATASGCYSCNKNAQINITCTSSFGSALAHVECGAKHFSVICEPEGRNETVWLSFDHAVISETCRVRCPASEGEFSLRGELHFVGSDTTSNDNIKQTAGYIPPADFPNIFKFFWDSITSLKWWITVSATLVTCLAVTLVLYVVVTVYCPCVRVMGRIGTKLHILIVFALILPHANAMKMNRDQVHQAMFNPGYLMDALQFLPVDDLKNFRLVSGMACDAVDYNRKLAGKMPCCYHDAESGFSEWRQSEPPYWLLSNPWESAATKESKARQCTAFRAMDHFSCPQHRARPHPKLPNYFVQLRTKVETNAIWISYFWGPIVVFFLTQVPKNRPIEKRNVMLNLAVVMLLSAMSPFGAGQAVAMKLTRNQVHQAMYSPGWLMEALKFLKVDHVKNFRFVSASARDAVEYHRRLTGELPVCYHNEESDFSEWRPAVPPYWMEEYWNKGNDSAITSLIKAEKRAV